MSIEGLTAKTDLQHRLLNIAFMLRSTSRKVIEDDGTAMEPMFLGERLDGNSVLAPLSPILDMPNFRSIMRANVREHDVVAYCIVSEAWAVPKGIPIQSRDLSKDPNRVQALLISGETTDGDILTIGHRIEGTPRRLIHPPMDLELKTSPVRIVHASDGFFSDAPSPAIRLN